MGVLWLSNYSHSNIWPLFRDGDLIDLPDFIDLLERWSLCYLLYLLPLLLSLMIGENSLVGLGDLKATDSTWELMVLMGMLFVGLIIYFSYFFVELFWCDFISEIGVFGLLALSLLAGDIRIFSLLLFYFYTFLPYLLLILLRSMFSIVLGRTRRRLAWLNKLSEFMFEQMFYLEIFFLSASRLATFTS